MLLSMRLCLPYRQLPVLRAYPSISPRVRKKEKKVKQKGEVFSHSVFAKGTGWESTIARRIDVEVAQVTNT